MTALELTRISVDYGEAPAVRDVSARFSEGGWVGLIGPNGAGKTSLLRVIPRLVPFGGSVVIDGVPTSSMSRRELSQRVAYVPQRPVVPDGMSVTDYALLGRTPHISFLGTEGMGDHDVVREVLERLELSDFAQRPLATLSGGELQRAVLARALSQRASILVLDEPTAALDVGHQQQVLELVDEVRIADGLAVISAMHDLTLAAQFAGHLILLAGGRIVGEGRPREVLTEPAILEHYGATVRILDERSGIVVVPSREHRASGIRNAR